MQQPVVVTNTGTDVLSITSITTSRPEISVNAKDRRYNDVWTYQKTHPVAFAEGDTVPKKIEINVPLEIKKGKYFFFTSVKKMDDLSSDSAFNNKLLKVK
ncbi:MAG: hypothetical protein GY950_24415 [bacterium]|nr:hypothetical protein [bacterium]